MLTYPLLKGFSSLGSVVAASIRCNADTCTLPRQIGKMVVDCNCHGTHPVAAAVLDCEECGGLVDVLEKSIQLRKPSNDTVFLEMSAIIFSYEWIRDNFMGFKKIDVFSDCKPAVDILLGKIYNPTYKNSFLHFRNLSKVVARRATLAAVSRELTLAAHWVARYGGVFYLAMREAEDVIGKAGIDTKSYLEKMVADVYVGDKTLAFSGDTELEQDHGDNTFVVAVFPKVILDYQSVVKNLGGELIKFLEKKKNVARHLFNVDKVNVFEADRLLVVFEGKIIKDLSFEGEKNFLVVTLSKNCADGEDKEFVGLDRSTTSALDVEGLLNGFGEGEHRLFWVRIVKDSGVRRDLGGGCVLVVRVTRNLLS